MFRFVAALCRDESVMAVVGSSFFLILILLGGFLLSAGPSNTFTFLYTFAISTLANWPYM